MQIVEKILKIPKTKDASISSNTGEIVITDSYKHKLKDVEISGNTFQQTYTGKNLFDYSKVQNDGVDIVYATLINSLSNGVEIQGAESEATNIYQNTHGWYAPGNASQNARITITDTTTLYISADVTLEEVVTEAKMRIYLYGTNNYTNESYIPLTLNQKIRISYSYSAGAGTYRPIFTLCSNKVKIENIMISTSSDTNYEPYVRWKSKSFTRLPTTSSKCKWRSRSKSSKWK